MSISKNSFYGMGGSLVRKIYIATWGDFHRWGEVVYEYDNRRKEAKDSLAIVAEVERGGKGKNSDDNKLSILIFLPESLVATIRKPPIEPEDVSYAIESLKYECRYFIYHELGVTRDNDLAIRVIPSKGLFIASRWPCSSKIRFETHMADAKHIMYKHLMDHVIREISLLMEEADKSGEEGSKPRLEVILDLTHSINYFSALAHENVMKLMGLLEIVKNLLGIDTVLKVINADPYIQGIKKQTLTVNPLYTVDEKGGGRKSYIIHPYLPFIESTKDDMLNGKKPYLFPKGSGELAKKLSNHLKQYVKERIEYVEFLSKAYHLNAPLALMTARIDIMERGLREIIEMVLATYYERATEVYMDGDTLVVKHYMSLTDSFHDIVSIYGFARLLNMSGRVNKCRPTMEELANFSKNLYHNNVQSRMIVDKELGSVAYNVCRYIRKKVESGVNNGCIRARLKDVFVETMGMDYASSDKMRSTRNFVAHGGLAKEVVCIDIEVDNRLTSTIKKGMEDGREGCGEIREIIVRTRIWYDKDWRCLLRSYMAPV